VRPPIRSIAYRRDRQNCLHRNLSGVTVGVTANIIPRRRPRTRSRRGRAVPSHGRGRRFNPYSAHQRLPNKSKTFAFRKHKDWQLAEERGRNMNQHSGENLGNLFSRRSASSLDFQRPNYRQTPRSRRVGSQVQSCHSEQLLPTLRRLVGNGMERTLVSRAETVAVRSCLPRLLLLQRAIDAPECSMPMRRHNQDSS
jgi:hypothetical protein